MATKRESSVPVTGGVIVRPGDMTAESAKIIKDGLMERMPQLADVVVVAGATGLAAYCPSTEGTEP